MSDLVFSKLSLTYVTGFNDKGEPIFKSKHYRNVDTQASNENLYNTAIALASLQQHELDLVERSNTYDLAE